MDPELKLVMLVGAALLLPFVLLTTMGARRRGCGPWVAVSAGLLFPVTWVYWYIRDEHPYRRAGRRRSSRPASPSGV